MDPNEKLAKVTENLTELNKMLDDLLKKHAGILMFKPDIGREIRAVKKRLIEDTLTMLKS